MVLVHAEKFSIYPQYSLYLITVGEYPVSDDHHLPSINISIAGIWIAYIYYNEVGALILLIVEVEILAFRYSYNYLLSRVLLCKDYFRTSFPFILNLVTLEVSMYPTYLYHTHEIIFIVLLDLFRIKTSTFSRHALILVHPNFGSQFSQLFIYILHI